MLLTVLGFFGVLALAYGVLMLFPAERHATMLAQAISDSQTKLAEIQAQAQDVEKNGWKSPTFLPYWGRRGMEFVEAAPVGKTVEAWLAQVNQGPDKKVDHKARLAAGDSEYRKALAEFEKLAPELLASMNKPVFTAPDTAPPSYTTPSINYLGVRGCAQAVVGLAGARAAQGKVGEALDMLVSVLHLGQAMQEPRGTLNEVFITAIDLSAADGYLGTIDPRASAPLEAWVKFSAAAGRAVPTPEAYAQTLEAEVMMAHNTFVELPSSPTQAGFPSLVALPGFLAREQRIFSNQIGDILQAARTGASPPVPSANPGMMDYIAGRSGIYADMMLPNTSKVPTVLESRRRMLITASVAAGASAYLTKNGSLPKTLADIRSVAEIPGDVIVNAAEVTYEVKDGKALVKVTANSPTMLDNLAMYGPPAWTKIENDTLTIII